MRSKIVWGVVFEPLIVTAIRSWFNSKPPKLVKTPNWCSPSPFPILPLKWSRLTVVLVGHKGAGGRYMLAVVIYDTDTHSEDLACQLNESYL